MTALYEIVPMGVPLAVGGVDALQYQQPGEVTGRASDELLTVKLRYKAPDGDESRLISRALGRSVRSSSPTLAFASSVAEVGMLLRGSKHAPAASFERAIARARSARGEDANGDRAEFIKLAELAELLKKLRHDTSQH